MTLVLMIGTAFIIAAGIALLILHLVIRGRYAFYYLGKPFATFSILAAFCLILTVSSFYYQSFAAQMCNTVEQCDLALDGLETPYTLLFDKERFEILKAKTLMRVNNNLAAL